MYIWIFFLIYQHSLTKKTPTPTDWPWVRDLGEGGARPKAHKSQYEILCMFMTSSWLQFLEFLENDRNDRNFGRSEISDTTEIAEIDRNFGKMYASETSEIMRNFAKRLTETDRNVSWNFAKFRWFRNFGGNPNCR